MRNIAEEGFAAIGAAVAAGAQYAAVHGACVHCFATQPATGSSEDRASTQEQTTLRRKGEGARSPARPFVPPVSLQLSEDELAMLQGQGCSEAAQVRVQG
jgi:hypothetical protein